MEGPLFFLVVMMIFAIVFVLERAAKQRVIEFIQHEVEKLGGRAVDVKPMLNNSRDTWTFSVSFQDASGLPYKTVCKTRANVSSRNQYQLYWRDSLRVSSQLSLAGSYKEQLIGDLQAENQRLQAKLIYGLQATTSVSSAKEQIISDLTAENQRLQAELEKWQQAKSKE